MNIGGYAAVTLLFGAATCSSNAQLTVTPATNAPDTFFRGKSIIGKLDFVSRTEPLSVRRFVFLVELVDGAGKRLPVPQYIAEISAGIPGNRFPQSLVFETLDDGRARWYIGFGDVTVRRAEATTVTLEALLHPALPDGSVLTVRAAPQTDARGIYTGAIPTMDAEPATLRLASREARLTFVRLFRNDAADGGSTALVRLLGEPERFYALERTADFRTWENAGSAMTRADDGTALFASVAEAGRAKFFYRARLLP